MNPLGLALCSLATLVAIPVLFFSGGKSSLDIDASELTAASSASMSGSPTTGSEAADTVQGEGGTATADSLLDTVNGQSLLDGGADPDAALEAHGASTTSVVDNSLMVLASAASAAASIAPSPSAAGPSAPTGNENRSASSTSPSPSPEAPTTALPATAPSTAAPTTAAPATAAPAAAAPTTAAPTTAAPAPVEDAAPSSDQAATAKPTARDAQPHTLAEAAPPESASAAEPASAPGEPSADDWAALRQCESFGDYGIVSANGRHHGAYQFGVGTWNSTANAAGRPDLVGVLPSEASAADQDALAYTLWTIRGWAPWPYCSHGLG